MSAEYGVPPPSRTWRVPVAQQVLTFIAVAGSAALVALAAVLFSAGPAGWSVVGACSLGLGVLGWRIVTMRVSLTPDWLIVRNLGGTERLAVADIRAVRFRRGTLTVTTARRPPGRLAAASGRYYGEGSARHTLRMLGAGTAFLTGRRCRADDAAQVIAAAAGLPPVPARCEVIPLPLAVPLMLIGAGLMWEGHWLNVSFNPSGAVLMPVGYWCVIIGGYVIGGYVIGDHVFGRFQRRRS